MIAIPYDAYDELEDFTIMKSVSGKTLGFPDIKTVAKVQFEGSYTNFILTQQMDEGWKWCNSNVEWQFREWERDQTQGFTSLESGYQYMNNGVRIRTGPITNTCRFFYTMVQTRTRNDVMWTNQWTNEHVYTRLPRPLGDHIRDFDYKTDEQRIKVFMMNIWLSYREGAL